MYVSPIPQRFADQSDAYKALVRDYVRQSSRSILDLASLENGFSLPDWTTHAILKQPAAHGEGSQRPVYEKAFQTMVDDAMDWYFSGDDTDKARLEKSKNSFRLMISEMQTRLKDSLPDMDEKLALFLGVTEAKIPESIVPSEDTKNIVDETIAELFQKADQCAQVRVVYDVLKLQGFTAKMGVLMMQELGIQDFNVSVHIAMAAMHMVGAPGVEPRESRDLTEFLEKHFTPHVARHKTREIEQRIEMEMGDFLPELREQLYL